MTSDKARKWVIIASLIITGVQLVFLILAPALGFPLEYPKNFDILQIVLPVFLGYLGSATTFVFMAPPPSVSVNNQFLGLLVRGPIIIYGLAMVAAFAAFAYSNRSGAPIGGGMSVSNLAAAVSISLGVLAVTTGVMVSYLFVTDQSGQNDPSRVQAPTPSPAIPSPAARSIVTSVSTSERPPPEQK